MKDRGPRPVRYDHHLEFTILQSSSQLDDVANISASVHTLKRSLAEGVEYKEKLIKMMLDRVSSMNMRDMGMSMTGIGDATGDSISRNSNGSGSMGTKKHFRTENLIKCADSAIAALGVLDREEDGVKWYSKEVQRMEELFSGYIRKQPPLAWSSLFNSSFNLAIFLKYANFEDISTAYEQMVTFNTRGDGQLNERLAPLLQHARSVYSSPIISKEEIAEIMADTSPSSDVYNRVLSSLEQKGRVLPSEESRLIYQLSLAWIRHFNRDSSIKFPVPPRNVQIINMLCISEWIFRTCQALDSHPVWATNLFSRLWSSSDYRCLITQVGTGEGKR